MKQKILYILILFFSLQHCDYKPIYLDTKNYNFRLNVLEVSGDEDMNKFIYSNISKYSNLSSDKVFNLKIDTSYTKKDLIKNKKGEIKTFLIINKINFTVIKNDKNKSYSFSEEIKTVNSDNQFEFKQYEKTIKNNFVNSKINELVLKLSNPE